MLTLGQKKTVSKKILEKAENNSERPISPVVFKFKTGACAGLDPDIVCNSRRFGNSEGLCQREKVCWPIEMWSCFYKDQLFCACLDFFVSPCRLMGGPSSSSPRTKRQFPPEHLLDLRKTSTTEEEYEDGNSTRRNISTPGYILDFFYFCLMSTTERTENDCDRALQL